MTDPVRALETRIAEFERVADPELILDPAALAEAEQAMLAGTDDLSDAATWRLIGKLHLARYRLSAGGGREAAVAGAFFAAVAVADPARLPDRLRGARVPAGDPAETWAGLVEEVLGHVDPGEYRHLGLLVQALVRRAMSRPAPGPAERLARLLPQEAMRSPDPAWAADALAQVGVGLVRLFGLTGERAYVDDAVHVLLRAALAAPGRAGELATVLDSAHPDDPELTAAYRTAAEREPGPDRSRALLALADLTRSRANASVADADLLAFIRAGQCALDFWHDRRTDPALLAAYAAGLVEWYVATGDRRSLEAAREIQDALGPAAGKDFALPDLPYRVPGGSLGAPDASNRGDDSGLGADPVARRTLLAGRRLRRFEVTGAAADLEVAVEVLREALSHAPDAHPDRPVLLVDLATALLHRAATRPPVDSTSPSSAMASS
ncbi:hypothetical protein HII36_46525, partial [Nonomuraea sp. NN258]|uniref:hypothetical protein n=1 Tax=Nonomuraea antri TaxID=2730852 RepID=UPI0038B31763|nr:hypothetical protein [Nonomuraea antri]